MVLVVVKLSPQEYNQKEHRKSHKCPSPREKDARDPLLAHITISWPTSILYADQRLDML